MFIINSLKHSSAFRSVSYAKSVSDTYYIPSCPGSATSSVDEELSADAFSQLHTTLTSGHRPFLSNWNSPRREIIVSPSPYSSSP